MKILWLTNFLLPEISNEIGLNANPFGGWLTGALKNIKEKDIELAICCPQEIKSKTIVGITESGIKYYCFYKSKLPGYIYDKKMEWIFNDIISDFKPDLVHIWGSEYSNALVMSKINSKNKSILNIQGLCSMYKYHYFGGISNNIINKNTIRDIVKNDNLNKQFKNFVMQAKNEEQIFKNIKYVVGRTEWDYIGSKILNPDIDYFFCNETLRDSFYCEKKWNYNKCEKYSAFVSQWSYPIKGFHFLIEATPYILKQFPEFKIYTTGISPNKIPFYRLTSFQKYIKKLIEKYNLEKVITFLGVLDEKEMYNMYLKSNVFVSPSTIENSSNSIGEAMILGVPTVASNVGGTNTILKDKEDGFLYQYDAPYMLAYYICKIFEDGELADKISNNAKCHANKTHNQIKNANDLYNIYNQIINGSENNNEKKSWNNNIFQTY